MGWVEGVKMGTEWYNDRIAQERQAAIDAQNKQLFDAKMEEMNRAKLERQQLADASKPAQTSMQDAAVDLGNGQKVYAMPRGIDSTDVASTDARQARMLAERGTDQVAPLPQVKPAQYMVNGKAFADPGSMQAAVTEYESPQALAQRQAAVLNAQGNPTGAMQLVNAAMESKLKGFQLSDAETAQANTKFNTHVDEVIARSPDRWTGLAAIGTETQVGPMKDVKVRVQSDGTNMRFVATLPDGTEKPGSVYPNTDEGFAKARYDLMKLDPATKSKVLDEQVKSAREQGNKDADRKIKQREADSRAELRIAQAENQFMLSAIAAARAGGGGAAGGVPLQEIYKRLEADFTTKDPETGKSTKDVASISTVRNLVLQMPAAQVGDVDGAYLQAMQLYQKAQTIGAGDPVKTQQALASILGGSSKDSGYPKASDEEVAKIRKANSGGATMSEVASQPKASENILAKLIPGGRESLLEKKMQQGNITDAEKAELAQLKKGAGKEWWRGQASEASY